MKALNCLKASTCATSLNRPGPVHIPPVARAVDGRNQVPQRRSHYRWRSGSKQATNIRAERAVSSSNGTSSSSPSWSQRMASIQALMCRVQEQLQGMSGLEAKQPVLARELKAKAEAHLDLLMQLAEAEQKHITGEIESEALQQILDDMQQQLELEQQAARKAQGNQICSSDSSEVQNVAQQKANELLDSNEDLRKAVGEASAELNSTRQSQEAAAVEQLQKQLAETRAQLETAESALQDSQQLRMEYDMMCQHGFELSRKLSAAESERAELKREVAELKAQLAGSAEALAEHYELQMQHDKLCQDMYRMRMMLQQARSNGTEAVQDAANTANKHKQDITWLMEAHRKEVAELHRKNQELAQDSQKLRMRLLEQEEKVWGQRANVPSAPAAPAASPVTSTPDADSPAAGAPPADEGTSALLAQQQEQLTLLQQASQQLTAEKQQLMKNLQDMQRQQAVLLVELQQVREQQKHAEAAAEAVAAVAAEPAGPSETELDLVRRLQAAEQQRSSLILQVQELQHSLQETRAAAAAAQAGTKAPTAAGAVSAEKLAEVKAEMVQLKGQLAATRRELQLVSGRAQAAEAALERQAAQYEARLAQLNMWYGKQAVVAAQLRKGKKPAKGSVGFTNTNRFWVGQELVFDFLKHWVVREVVLQQQPGFLGLQVEPVPGVSADGGVDVVISSYWESIPLYEAWRNSTAATQQHLPTGVYQYVPKRGEGFPEDFVPFRDYDEAVNAKY